MSGPHFSGPGGEAQSGSGPGTRGGRSSLPNLRPSARSLAPLLVFGAFALVAALYLFARPIYFVLLQDWGVLAFRFPFLDMHAIVSAIECKRQGVDVMRENPCDVLSRPHVYSPLWLAIAFLPIDENWLVPTGIILDLLFIGSLYWLPIDEARTNRLVIAGAAFSPAVVYALERANNDLIIFLLVVVLARLAMAPWPRRTLSYAIILLAALLKYYPAALFILMLREAPRRFVLVIAGSAFVVIAFILSYRYELAENFEALKQFSTGYFTDAFDFRNLPFGFISLLSPSVVSSPLLRTALLVAMLAILFGDLVSRIWRFTGYETFFADVAELPSDQSLCLLIGASLITGCFFLGHSVLYRTLFFWLTLPGLLTLSRNLRDPTLRVWLRQIVVLIVFLMWSEFFRHLITAGATALFDQRWSNTVQIIFWACKELAWWRVIAILCALLVALITELPMGRLLFGRFVQLRVATKP